MKVTVEGKEIYTMQELVTSKLAIRRLWFIYLTRAAIDFERRILR